MPNSPKHCTITKIPHTNPHTKHKTTKINKIPNKNIPNIKIHLHTKHNQTTIMNTQT